MSDDGPSDAKRAREEDVVFRVISKEDKEFTLSKKAAQLCGTVNHYAENTGLTDDEAISKMEPMALPNVSSESLYYIVRWCEQHRDCPAWEEEKWWENERDAELTKWEKEFMAEMTSEALHDVYLAANYMDIKCLLDKCAQTIADMIKGKSPEEIREIWGVENDFTAEEEEAIKNEDPWKVILDYQEKLDREEEEAAQRGSSLTQA
ncbi:unnamed protein product, partial [Mesorhabditis belari]|uniref:Skp1-related protein n=1 Tax=Mesorhabditis belari TaxID=2138241 RepID=A0AAF3EZ86_9BILA